MIICIYYVDFLLGNQCLLVYDTKVTFSLQEKLILTNIL